MSSDSEAENPEDELSFLIKQNIDRQDSSNTGKRIIWANNFSYTHRTESSRNVGVDFFYCHHSKGKKKCKGKGFTRSGRNYFFVTKNHNHDAKPYQMETKLRMKEGLRIAEASPSTKTKSLRRSMKRGAGPDVLSVLPKDASIARQIQRKKYKVNMATVDSRNVEDMVIPDAAKLTHDGNRFLRFDSRLTEPSLPWIVVWMSDFGHDLLKRAKVIAFDATYKKTPRGFYQYFTLHGMIDGKFCVIGFSWMRSKSEKTFRRVFKEFFYLPAIEYCVEAFVSDFESGPSNVVLSIFPSAVAIRCIFHLSQAEQQWAKKHGMDRFYVNGELRDWIILFSKLAYLPCKNVPSGFHALIREYEGMVHNRIASDADDQRVTAFFKYIRTTYIYRGDDAQPRKPLYSIDLWNVNHHVVKQRPVTNNAVEAWNKEYKSHFPGSGKPDRSKVIRHQMDEEEAVRHAIIRLLFKFRMKSNI